MRWLLAPALVLALAAPASGAGVPRACTLLSGADVKRALDGAAQWHEARGSRGWQMCTWHGKPFSPSIAQHPQLILMVNKASRSAVRRQANQSMSSEPVRGVGELAFTMRSGEWLVVWDHGVQLTVQLVGNPNSLPLAKRAALAALGRL